MNTTLNNKPGLRQTGNKVDQDQIAERAFQLWEAAKRPAGRDLEFWLKAEAELNTSQNRAAKLGQRQGPA